MARLIASCIYLVQREMKKMVAVNLSRHNVYHLYFIIIVLKKLHRLKRFVRMTAATPHNETAKIKKGKNT